MPKMKFVYTITELSRGGRVWNKIGVAFVNSDGSLNVKLNALPIDGKCQIRDADVVPSERYIPDDDPFNGGDADEFEVFR